MINNKKEKTNLMHEQVFPQTVIPWQRRSDDLDSRNRVGWGNRGNCVGMKEKKKKSGGGGRGRLMWELGGKKIKESGGGR